MLILSLRVNITVQCKNEAEGMEKYFCLHLLIQTLSAAATADFYIFQEWHPFAFYSPPLFYQDYPLPVQLISVQSFLQNHLGHLHL